MQATLSASSLIGDNVVNAQGENVGNLKEIMLDTATGKVAYGVLDFGGIAGIGNDLFAVPWSAFTVDTDNEQLRLNVDKETLENAEGFDQNNWPDTANRDWGQKVHDFYGATPYWS